MVQGGPFNEMFADGAAVRPHYLPYSDWLATTPPERIREKLAEADLLFRRAGITFAVYGDETGTERLIPFDIVPRIIPAAEWDFLQRGLRQRVTALNAFLHDVYHDQEILRAGRIPAAQVLCNVQYRPEMQGVDVPMDVYAHIAGIDLVRAGAGEYYVLEDNLRVPSGVSYMLEDRKAMMRLFPELFARYSVAPVEHYPDLLLETLRSVAPAGVRDPTVVLLTPGAFNSAYFEHAFLAQQMGIELVEGQDLFVDDEIVYMRTTHRRRLPRSARLPRGLDARRAGAAHGVSCGTRDRLECRRHRDRRRQIDLPLRAGDDPLLSRRGTAARQRADLDPAPACRPRLRARAPRRTRGEGSPRCRVTSTCGRSCSRVATW
jgi:uncharacterized circularly permuted ATP-grasp superfamily protein